MATVGLETRNGRDRDALGFQGLGEKASLRNRHGHGVAASIQMAGEGEKRIARAEGIRSGKRLEHEKSDHFRDPEASHPAPADRLHGA
jgi:hypothetical protein